MPRAWSRKREREYEELKDEFRKEQRYPGREEEVAARIVNQQRARYGETKKARVSDRAGQSPDRNVPLDNYDELTVDEIVDCLGDLTPGELEQIERYERQHKNRRTLLEEIDRYQ